MVRLGKPGRVADLWVLLFRKLGEGVDKLVRTNGHGMCGPLKCPLNFRSPGDPNTGQNSVHFLVDPGDKVGLVVPTTGKLHGFETNPNVSPLEHLRNDMPW